MRSFVACLGLILLAAVAAKPGSTQSSTQTPPAAKRPASRPEATPAKRPESVKDLLQRARRQSRSQDMRGALATLERARALAPNSEEVLHAYAETTLAVRGPLSALGVLEALTRICPTVGQYWYLQGLALMQAGDVEAAVEPLREAARLEPAEPPILIALATALNDAMRYDEAKPFLLRALSLAPDSIEATAALAEAEAALGEPQQAEDHARLALARSAADATANRALGLVRMSQERYEEAREALSKAAAADPSSAKAYYQLSLASARLKDEAAAEKYLALYRERRAEAASRMRQVRAITGFSLGGMRQ